MYLKNIWNKKENECQPFGFEKDQMADFLCQEVSIWITVIIFYVNMKIGRAELEMTLIDKLRQKRKKYLFNIRKELIIIPAALGNDAGIIGSCQ